MIFEDRYDAGKQLARQLFRFMSEQPIIIALPRGGVPIGYEIAKLLHAPLSLIIVRKIGLPGRSEYGIGAVAEGGVVVLDEQTIKLFGLSAQEVQEIMSEEEEELERRAQIYRGSRKLPLVKNRTAILVDDGLATGVTAQGAIAAVRRLQPAKLIYASPVCASDSAHELEQLVDEVVCLAIPVDFTAVGAWYREFDQVADEEVILLLRNSQRFSRESHAERKDGRSLL